MARHRQETKPYCARTLETTLALGKNKERLHTMLEKGREPLTRAIQVNNAREMAIGRTCMQLSVGDVNPRSVATDDCRINLHDMQAVQAPRRSGLDEFQSRLKRRNRQTSNGQGRRSDL